MSGMKQGFITGANAKVKIHGITLAYATDVSYNVTVQTIPIESMGKYEVHANEPVAYMVDGTFSVIRYTKEAKTSGIPHVAADGNSPDKMASDNDGAAQDQIDPGAILTSKTFDLEVMQKISGDSDIAVSKVRECRLTRRGMTLNKRGVMVDNYAFVGIYLDDVDAGATGIAGQSGDEDLS